MILDLRHNSKFQPEIFDMLKNISYQKADLFNDIIANASSNSQYNLDWWVEQPASRNTFQSPLFYHFCCFHLVKELLESSTIVEKVISDSPGLNNILISLKEKYGARYIIQGPKGILSKFFFYSKNSAISILCALFAFKSKIIQFHYSKKTSKLTRSQKKKNLILIDIFVFPGFVTSDRYYQGLWDSLDFKQKNRVFFVPTLSMMKNREFENVYKELRKADRNFLCKEDYLQLSDLLFGLLHKFRVIFIRLNPIKIMGIDFSPLIRENLLSYKGFENALEGILNYRFSKRLKEQSFELSLVIDWWEGQPLDKGWNLGFNTFFPETITKGYFGVVPIPLALQLYPSENEIRNNVVPKKFSMIGRQFRNEMKSRNSKFKLEIAPAFRYGRIWGNGVINNQNPKSFKILVACSIFLNESIDIVNLVISSIENFDKNEIQLFIKSHPTMRIETLKGFIGKKWQDYIYDAEDLDVDPKLPDMLISGISSYCLEAVVSGIPVIVIENMRGLSYDPIPASVPKILWRKCRSSKEITKTIVHFKSRNHQEINDQRKLSAEIKKEYFEPVTNEGVCRFLELLDE